MDSEGNVPSSDNVDRAGSPSRTPSGTLDLSEYDWNMERDFNGPIWPTTDADVDKRFQIGDKTGLIRMCPFHVPSLRSN